MRTVVAIACCVLSGCDPDGSFYGFLQRRQMNEAMVSGARYWEPATVEATLGTPGGDGPSGARTPGSPPVPSPSVPIASPPVAAGGGRGLGERCSRDCQCASLECKGFKCVARNFSAHPLLGQSAACTFDGDCASCDCSGGRCR